MTNISKNDISLLEKNFYILRIALLEKLKSKDGTEKFLFELPDKEVIESVFIPRGKYNTACLSSQVGCRFACIFCASGKKFVRNLSTSEIITQLLEMMNITKKKITHIVFMGIGEPLDNYDNVIRAIHILNSPLGFNIGARRITISSCGIIPKIKKLKNEGLQIELSISLHSADDCLRSRLMPVNKKYPVRELIACLKDYIKQTNRQITFEYVLIKDVNDRIDDINMLIRALKGLNCKINLILCNLAEKGAFKRPSKKQAQDFKYRLIKNGLHSTLRKSRGEDIRAACGQLRIRHNFLS
jgi:23S rRNA (adenine2503-C2)-methyltransferase